MNDKANQKNGARDDDVPAAGGDAARQLLDYLEGQRAERCRAVLEQADAEADALRREARHRALMLVREAVRRERSHRAAGIREEHARIDARFRRERFRRERQELEIARQRLVAMLNRRWRDGVEARQEWLQMTCEQALAFLPDGAWRIVHPADWDTSEARPAVDALARLRPDVKPGFEGGGQESGLYLACGAASVDTRPAGLLADRQRIDGLLLRALEITDPGTAGTEEDA